MKTNSSFAYALTIDLSRMFSSFHSIYLNKSDRNNIGKDYEDQDMNAMPPFESDSSGARP